MQETPNTYGCQKDTDDLTVFFTLLGSTSAKAVRRTLMKLTPGLSNWRPYCLSNAAHNDLCYSLYA